MYDSVLKEQAKYLKRDAKGVETMCKAVEDFAEKRVVESKYETANKMIDKGMPVEQISEILDIPVEKVLELKEQLVVA